MLFCLTKIIIQASKNTDKFYVPNSLHSGINGLLRSTSNIIEPTIPLLLGIIGGLLTTFWLFIPYWKGCQWILFSVLIYFTILTHIHKVSIFRHLLLVCSILWGVFYLAKYLIIPFTPVSLYVSTPFIVVFLIILLYRPIIIPILNKKRQKLTWKLKSVCGGMPMPENAIFDRKSEKKGKKAIKQFYKLDKKIKKTTNIEKKQYLVKELCNHRMHTFYEICLRAESNGNKNAYSQFEEQLKEAKIINDISILRQDVEEHNILSNMPTSAERFIMEWDPKIKRINLNNKDYSNEYISIQTMDTSKKVLFVHRDSRKKIKEQTEKLQKLVSEIDAERRRNFEIQSILNNELARIRLIVYRNIYLGIDLLQYDNNNVKAKHLTTEKDYFNILSEFESIIADIDFYKNELGYYSKNTLREVQGVLRKEISTLSAKLLKERAQLAKTLELIECLSEFNNKFCRIYAPLRNKVFILGDKLSTEDVTNIALELNTIKKISTTNLK